MDNKINIKKLMQRSAPKANLRLLAPKDTKPKIKIRNPKNNSNILDNLQSQNYCKEAYNDLIYIFINIM